MSCWVSSLPQGDVRLRPLGLKGSEKQTAAGWAETSPEC